MRCATCFKPVVRCTMTLCAFSGYVHEATRLHQCYPAFHEGVQAPYAAVRGPRSEPATLTAHYLIRQAIELLAREMIPGFSPALGRAA